MKHTISIMSYKPVINDIEYTGYAFIDERGHCIIIVYGEKKRDLMIEYLNGN